MSIEIENLNIDKAARTSSLYWGVNLDVETTLYASPASGHISLGHEFIINSFNPDNNQTIKE